DARSAIGKALVRALHAAGAGLIVAGLGSPARAGDLTDEVFALEGVQPVALDITDPRSVAEALSKIGGPLDVVINSARYVREGGVSRGGNLIDQRRALEVSAMGLM